MRATKPIFPAIWSALAVIFMLGVAPTPAHAADPIFPIGSLVGLVPPPGMTMSRTFPGFEDPEAHAVIIINTLPAAAFAQLKNGNGAADELKKQGVIVKEREPFKVGIGTGTLIIGRKIAPDKTQFRNWLLLAGTKELTALVNVQAPEASKAYPDSAVRTALRTLSVRASVPKDEFLKLLPFSVGDLAGYRIANIIPGRAMLLTDMPKVPRLVVTNGIPKYDLDARMLIAAIPGGPASDTSRSEFARLAFASIGGIKDVEVTMSEPVRISHQEAFETVARAKDTRTDSDVMVVQWLRFGSGGFLQIVGISRADTWESEFPRMRELRDGVHFR